MTRWALSGLAALLLGACVPTASNELAGCPDGRTTCALEVTDGGTRAAAVDTTVTVHVAATIAGLRSNYPAHLVTSAGTLEGKGRGEDVSLTLVQIGAPDGGLVAGDATLLVSTSQVARLQIDVGDATSIIFVPGFTDHAP